ncbi:MAG: phosphoadenylyl-sulfate reductase [Acidobacteriaceae bacterium]|jgi:phosphoadenylyl-sulfate reductase (thioredoxin)|nr:phosphoadenylyl-sulfate reductase [Acidobacteriaceae bacterium]
MDVTPRAARPDREQLAEWAATLEGKPVEQILQWAAEQYAPRISLACGFGMEGCVLIDVVARLSLPIDLFTLDTGLLFPETYALWSQLEAKYGLTIRAVRPERTVEQQAVVEGPALWTVDPDRCCELRKMQPLRQTLAPVDAWVSAVRRDQTPDRADLPVVGWDGRYGLVKVNPLVTWTSEDVRAYLKTRDVPYNPLHDRGYPSIGCAPCTTPVAPGEDPRSGRWRGREKKECGLHLRPRTA